MALADNFLPFRNSARPTIHGIAGALRLGRTGNLAVAGTMMLASTGLWVHIAMTGDAASVFLRGAMATVLLMGSVAIWENETGRAPE